MASTAKLKFSNSQNIKVLSKYLPDNLGELRLSAFYVAVGRDCFVLRYNFLICLQCSLQKNSLIVGNLRHFVLSFNISNRQLVIIYATYLARNIYGAQILIYTLGTGGKGEVFMASRECFAFIFITTMQYISYEAIILVLVFFKDEFTLRKQCKTGVIAFIAY